MQKVLRKDVSFPRLLPTLIIGKKTRSNSLCYPHTETLVQLCLSPLHNLIANKILTHPHVSPSITLETAEQSYALYRILVGKRKGFNQAV
jgi:hypothetical protein